MIKKKSKEKHAVRKQKKRKSMWWVKEEDLRRPDHDSDVKDKRLFNACSKGSVTAVEAAIEGGANIQARRREDGGGMLLATPLHMACYYGSLEVVQALIDFKATVTAVDALRKSPLHYAAAAGSAAVC